MPEIILEPIETSQLGLHSNMLQSGFWGDFKSAFGWRAFAFRYRGKGAASGADKSLLVLVRELGAGQSLAYVPHGPMIETGSQPVGDWEFAAKLAAALRSHLPKSCMFIRFDPPWGLSFPALSKEQTGYPAAELSPESAFSKANMDIQPPSTVILNLDKTEEELLKGMKSKTRYNIKLAGKKGVEVRTAGIEALPQWYELYRTTAERDKIALHGYDYYEKIFNIAAQQPEGQGPELRLLQAVIDGEVEAGIITVWQGEAGADRRATYLYGASSNNKRNYMPSYALQWEAIKQASAAGCMTYDFFGIPPVDDSSHPMYGLYRFKTGFGGEILHRPGCWDFPYKKAAYKVFGAAEKLRNYYYKTLKKR